MASDSDWTTLGTVLDADGIIVEVDRDQHGTVCLTHAMGSVEFEAPWLTALRELLDRAAMPGQGAGTATEATPHSRCPWWSDPSDDFYGRCVKDVGHVRDGNSPRASAHENAKGIQWHGQRWKPAT